MQLLMADASSLHSTRSPAMSCIPSTTSRPPAVGFKGDPVEAALTGGNEPEVRSVLPVMELMAILLRSFGVTKDWSCEATPPKQLLRLRRLEARSRVSQTPCRFPQDRGAQGGTGKRGTLI